MGVPRPCRILISNLGPRPEEARASSARDLLIRNLLLVNGFVLVNGFHSQWVRRQPVGRSG
jgi:hypothetical protein